VRRSRSLCDQLLVSLFLLGLCTGGLGDGLGVRGNYAGLYSQEEQDALDGIGDQYGNDIGIREFDATGVTTQAMAVYDLDAGENAQLLFHIWATKGYVAWASLHGHLCGCRPLDSVFCICACVPGCANVAARSRWARLVVSLLPTGRRTPKRTWCSLQI
jgi:hypothetical protein